MTLITPTPTPTPAPVSGRPLTPLAQPAQTQPQVLPRFAPAQSNAPLRSELEVVAEDQKAVEVIAAESDELRRQLGIDPAMHVNISRRNAVTQEQGQLLQMVHARPRSTRVAAIGPDGVETNVTLQDADSQTRRTLPLTSPALPARVPVAV